MLMLMLTLRFLECEPGMHKHKRKNKSYLVSGIHQRIKSRPALSAENMATQVNEKLAESVRNYPCLYDKTSPDFKNRDKKNVGLE